MLKLKLKNSDVNSDNPKSISFKSLLCLYIIFSIFIFHFFFLINLLIIIFVFIASVFFILINHANATMLHNLIIITVVIINVKIMYFIDVIVIDFFIVIVSLEIM